MIEVRKPVEIPGLTETMTGEEATKQVLRHLFESIRTQESGVKNRTRTEALHDFRVAIRKTRSILSRMKKIIPPGPWSYFKQEFAWIGTISTPPRDIEVYLNKLADYQTGFPDWIIQDLQAFQMLIHKRQEQSYQVLLQGMNSERYHKLFESWEPFLLSSTPWEKVENSLQIHIKPLVSEQILKMFHRILLEESQIHQNTPPEALHELRKNCKKLRYLLEYFQSLYRTSTFVEIVPRLKKLQDCLGNFQDLQVHITLARTLGQQDYGDTNLLSREALAVGYLLKELLDRQQKMRQIFPSLFYEFSNFITEMELAESLRDSIF